MTLSSGSSYRPAVGGRSYLRKEVDLEKKAKALKSMVELNVSSIQLAPMLKIFADMVVTDRQIRRWGLATIDLAQKHFEDIIELDVKFGLAADGSKIGPVKYETILMLMPGQRNHVLAMVPVERETILIVKKTFQTIFDGLSARHQELFSRNCSYFVNDSAANAKGIAEAIDNVLDAVHRMDRPKLNCRLHSLLHQEEALEKEMTPAASKANESLRKILSHSRTHGLHESLGRKYSMHCEAEKRRSGAVMPTDAFDQQLGCRFGALNRNVGRTAVNFDVIVTFLKKNGQERLADHLMINKRELVLNFTAVALVWRHICVMLWSSVAKEQTCAEYRRTMETFKTATRLIKSASSPVEFMRRPSLNTMAESEEFIEGFDNLVNELMKSDKDRKELEEIVHRMIDATTKSYFHFELFPEEDLEVELET